jgi:hypothetical protein
MATTPNVCPRRKSELNERVVDGETIILDQQEGLVHHLNATASFIWSRCDGLHSPPVIAAELAAAYSLPRDAIAEDVARTLGQLSEAGLLADALGGSSER